MRTTIVVLAAMAGCAGGEAIEADWAPASSAGDEIGESTTTTAGEAALDDRPVDLAPDVAPISGGTLLVLDDDVTVVAADPDRDLVHVARIDGTPRVLATIALQSGDEPGRLAQDDDGRVHVVLRGTGEVLSLDPDDWTIVAREPTCPNPRGITWDAGRARVLVACAGGELVFHPPAGPRERSVVVEDDLRDIFVQDGTIHVSRFRSAELLAVDDDGTVTRRITLGSDAEQRVANVAWRTIATADGGWLMVHQSAATDPIPLDVPAYYDGGAGCFGPVTSALSYADPSGVVSHWPSFSFATLAVDVAIRSDGSQMAVAVAGQSDGGSPTMQSTRSVIILDEGTTVQECNDPPSIPLPAQPIAVAYTRGGTLVAQGREPATLMVSDAPGRFTELALEGDTRRDTGHDLFHQDAGTGVSCAGCHPEGGDDGRVWTFVDGDGNTFQRRTQSLRAGLASTAPFHWSGDMGNLPKLVEEIHGKRMGGAVQTDARVDAFEGWLIAIAPSNPQREPDDAALRGRASFVAHCSICHGDDGFAGNRTATVDGESLQVPSLRGVALRAPYMHDGRSHDLPSAVIDMLRLTDDPTITGDELDDLVAFLESL